MPRILLTGATGCIAPHTRLALWSAGSEVVSEQILRDLETADRATCLGPVHTTGRVAKARQTGPIQAQSGHPDGYGT